MIKIIHAYKELNWHSKSAFKNNDIFGISFNFINDDIQLYHNNVKADKLSLNGNKNVIFAVSLCDPDDIIEILKHEFC